MEKLILLTREQAKETLDKQPSAQSLASLSELYKMFGDPTRLRILSVLATREVCVNDLARLLDLTDSAVSHQLRLLKQGRLIASRREGKAVVYALADDHVQTLLQNGLEHILEK